MEPSGSSKRQSRTTSQRRRAKMGTGSRGLIMGDAWVSVNVYLLLNFTHSSSNGEGHAGHGPLYETLRVEKM